MLFYIDHSFVPKTVVDFAVVAVELSGAGPWSPTSTNGAAK